MSVGALDLAILLVYLAGVVALGTWVGRRAAASPTSCSAAATGPGG